MQQRGEDDLQMAEELSGIFSSNMLNHCIEVSPCPPSRREHAGHVVQISSISKSTSVSLTMVRSTLLVAGCSCTGRQVARVGCARQDGSQDVGVLREQPLAPEHHELLDPVDSRLHRELILAAGVVHQDGDHAAQIGVGLVADVAQEVDQCRVRLLPISLFGRSPSRKARRGTPAGTR